MDRWFDGSPVCRHVVDSMVTLSMVNLPGRFAVGESWLNVSSHDKSYRVCLNAAR